MSEPVNPASLSTFAIPALGPAVSTPPASPALVIPCFFIFLGIGDGSCLDRFVDPADGVRGAAGVLRFLGVAGVASAVLLSLPWFRQHGKKGRRRGGEPEASTVYRTCSRIPPSVASASKHDTQLQKAT